MAAGWSLGAGAGRPGGAGRAPRAMQIFLRFLRSSLCGLRNICASPRNILLFYAAFVRFYLMGFKILNHQPGCALGSPFLSQFEPGCALPDPR